MAAANATMETIYIHRAAVHFRSCARREAFANSAIMRSRSQTACAPRGPPLHLSTEPLTPDRRVYVPDDTHERTIGCNVENLAGHQRTHQGGCNGLKIKDNIHIHLQARTRTGGVDRSLNSRYRGSAP